MKTGPTSEGVKRMRVLVVDDHPLVREWLTNLINQQPDMTVCAEAADTPEARSPPSEIIMATTETRPPNQVPTNHVASETPSK